MHRQKWYNTFEMKKSEIVVDVVALGFVALACVGVVLGRDWKLLLVPLAVVPVLAMLGGMMAGLEEENRKTGHMLSALTETVNTTTATIIAYALCAQLAPRCPWAAGAMAAAMAAVSITSPFAGPMRSRALRVGTMLCAAVFYAGTAIVTSGNADIVGYGGTFSIPVFAVARIWLAVRDSKKGVSA